jgi:transposase
MKAYTMPQSSKLTPEVQTTIAKIIRAGGSHELAASVAGVTERTLYAWLERGGRPGRQEAPYRAFRAAVERAQAENEGILVAQVGKAASRGSWRAAAWLLERRHPERWGRPADRAESVSPMGDTADPLDALDELAPRRRGRPAT